MHILQCVCECVFRQTGRKCALIWEWPVKSRSWKKLGSISMWGSAEARLEVCYISQPNSITVHGHERAELQITAPIEERLTFLTKPSITISQIENSPNNDLHLNKLREQSMSRHTEVGHVCALGHICRCRTETETVEDELSAVTLVDMRVSAHMCAQG